MKKISACILLLVLMFSFAACGNGSSREEIINLKKQVEDLTAEVNLQAGKIKGLEDEKGVQADVISRLQEITNGQAEKIEEYERELGIFDDLPELEPLSEEFEDMLREDWENQRGSEFINGGYYGTHNGYAAIFRPGNATAVMTLIVGDTVFHYPYNFSIWVWKDGRFTNITDAYLYGLLNARDVKRIGYYHYQAMLKKAMERGLVESEEEFYEQYYGVNK